MRLDVVLRDALPVVIRRPKVELRACVSQTVLHWAYDSRRI